MRQFIYKTIIVIVALVVAFEFTIGKTINKFNQKAEMVFSKEGRKPTDVELQAIDQAWSEHCCYKSSKPVLEETVLLYQ